MTAQNVLGFVFLHGPFRLLGIDPSATAEAIQAAYARALEQREVSAAELAQAVASLLDPNPTRRLQYELAYPLDCDAEQAGIFFSGLSKPSPDAVLEIAKQLPPLSRANFIAGHAARSPLSGNLLIAFVDAHMAVDPMEIYRILKSIRDRAAQPTPSLLGLRDGLDRLMAAHCEAIFANHDQTEAIAEPVLQCLNDLSNRSPRPQLGALKSLMGAYRSSVNSLITKTEMEIESACRVLAENPVDNDATENLARALEAWALVSTPLLLWNDHFKDQSWKEDTAVGHVRQLLVDLERDRAYHAAAAILTIAFTAFQSIPSLRQEFEELGYSLGDSLAAAAIEPLERTLDELRPKLARLVEAVQKTGFSENSEHEARELWEAFASAALQTKSTPFDKDPWITVHQVASELQPHSSTAAATLTKGLIEFADHTAADPSIIALLHDDVANRGKECAERPEPDHSNRPSARKRMILFTCILLLTLSGVLLAYHQLGPIFALTTPKASPDTAKATAPELLPPIGKGQRLTREYVRYCHFQEERLRIVKQLVRGADDIGAYNALANDYNSRCSNFFYLDEDLRVVEEEVKARQAILETEARKIVSTWPWHTGAEQAPVKTR